jgi:hypothetical protein
MRQPTPDVFHRGMLSLSTLLGALGIFSVCLSFEEPELGGYGLVLLIAASGLVLAE